MLVASFNRYMNKHLNISTCLSWETAKKHHHHHLKLIIAEQKKINPTNTFGSSTEVSFYFTKVHKREIEKFLHTMSNLMPMIHNNNNNNNNEKIAHHLPSMSEYIIDNSQTFGRSLLKITHMYCRSRLLLVISSRSIWALKNNIFETLMTHASLCWFEALNF